MASLDSARVGTLKGFGTVLVRSRLLGVLKDRAEPVVLLSAPGGYGKSVIAAQIAASDSFEKCHWIDASGLDSDVRSLEAALASTSVVCDSCFSSTALAAPDDDEYETQDDTSHVRPATEALRVPTCVVLDNLRLPSPRDLGLFAEELRALSSSSSLLVVTTRDDVSAFEDGRVFVVPGSCLKLDDSEAIALVRMYAGAQWVDEDCRKLVQASGGLPAILSVLSRQAALASLDEALSAAVSRDVLDHLRMLAADQLGDSEACVLLAMTLLGEGSAVQVSDVVGVHDCQAEIERVADVVPLVRVDASSGSFRVHDLAIAAYGVSGTGEIEDDVLLQVRRACMYRSGQGWSI